MKMNECHPNASCNNTQSSYKCSCNPTYMGMVLIAKIRLVFCMHEGDEIYILFPMLNVAVYCLELTFIRNSHRRC